MERVGMVVGKFDPLHIGHVNLIQEVSGMFDKVIVILSHSDKVNGKLFEGSRLKRKLTAKDKLTIIQKTFQVQREVIIPVLVDETDVPNYPNGWEQWSELVKAEVLKHSRVRRELLGEGETEQEFFKRVTVVVNELDDVKNYDKYFGVEAKVLDVNREEFPISATKIRKNPYKYWEYVTRASRYYLTPRVAICGGESSGKTMMVSKLANVFATTSVGEYGRHIVETELGGDEGALQYENYADIVHGHYHDMKFALTNANKVMFSDTDFIATQAFCEVYEGTKHPVVEKMIEEVKFDLVILLDNSTKWVDDGMRMLGESDSREHFQNTLKRLYKEHGISYVEVTLKGYNERYNMCKWIVQEYLETTKTVEELQLDVLKMEAEINGNGE